MPVPRRAGRLRHLRSPCGMATGRGDGARTQRAPRTHADLDLPAVRQRAAAQRPRRSAESETCAPRTSPRYWAYPVTTHAADGLGPRAGALARARDQRHGPDASPARLPARRLPRRRRAVSRSALGHDPASLAPLADGRAESPPESILRLYWIDAGLPWPVPQLEVWVDGILIARLDIGNAEIRYAVEYDGVEWHSSPEQVAHDRRRRLAVREQGFAVDVFTKANVFGQRRDVETRLLPR